MSESTTPSQLAYTTSYQIERSHSRSEGIVILPIAGPGVQAASAVRVHAPIEYESVFWSASKKGGPPTIPSWKSFITDPNKIFLGGSRTALIPVSLATGHTYVVAGAYHYALLLPIGLDSQMDLGIQPWEIGAMIPEDHFIPSGNFVQGLLTPRTPVSGGVIRTRQP